jgi:hypothetical protein
LTTLIPLSGASSFASLGMHDLMYLWFGSGLRSPILRARSALRHHVLSLVFTIEARFQC